MPTTLPPPEIPGAVGNELPVRLKLLCVTTLHNSGEWISRALASEGASQVKLDEAVGATSALSRLREEAFDAVIVLHEPGVLDGPGFVEALRAGGHDDAAIVLGEPDPPDCAAECHHAGADAYCSIRHTTPRVLMWELATAIRRAGLQSENRRLHEAEQQRLSIEHQEAERLLAEQRGLLVELDQLRKTKSGWEGASSAAGDQVLSAFQPAAATDMPEALVANYRDVLRAYVIMGVGNLSVEMAKLAELLASSGVSAQRAVQLHLDVLERLVRGLGARSTRHVMNRADLLILELMIHLADGYRRRYRDVESPPEQLLLPGFAPSAERAA